VVQSDPVHRARRFARARGARPHLARWRQDRRGSECVGGASPVGIDPQLRISLGLAAQRRGGYERHRHGAHHCAPYKDCCSYDEERRRSCRRRNHVANRPKSATMSERQAELERLLAQGAGRPSRPLGNFRNRCLGARMLPEFLDVLFRPCATFPAPGRLLCCTPALLRHAETLL